MTREGAIITLTNVASLLRDGTRYMKPEHEKQFREAYEMAIKALEQPEQRWIPCSIKQPKKGLMLVSFNDGDMALLKQPTAYRRFDIVAWMPVEPYRGEGEEDAM